MMQTSTEKQLTATAQPATISDGSQYSIWHDPNFWAFCEILADVVLEQVRKDAEADRALPVPAAPPAKC